MVQRTLRDPHSIWKRTIKPEDDHQNPAFSRPKSPLSELSPTDSPALGPRHDRARRRRVGPCVPVGWWHPVGLGASAAQRRAWRHLWAAAAPRSARASVCGSRCSQSPWNSWLDMAGDLRGSGGLYGYMASWMASWWFTHGSLPISFVWPHRSGTFCTLYSRQQAMDSDLMQPRNWTAGTPKGPHLLYFFPRHVSSSILNFVGESPWTHEQNPFRLALWREGPQILPNRHRIDSQSCMPWVKLHTSSKVLDKRHNNYIWYCILWYNHPNDADIMFRMVEHMWPWERTYNI